MACVAKIQRNMQSKLIFEKPGDELDDDHLAKIIVYLISEFIVFYENFISYKL